MLIFTPAVQFTHDDVRIVQVLPGRAHDTYFPPLEARVVVQVNDDGRFAFYGAEAFSVLCQLEEAGFYTTAQRLAVAARLGDEMALACAAKGVGTDD